VPFVRRLEGSYVFFTNTASSSCRGGAFRVFCEFKSTPSKRFPTVPRIFWLCPTLGPWEQLSHSPSAEHPLHRPHKRGVGTSRSPGRRVGFRACRGAPRATVQPAWRRRDGERPSLLQV